MLSTFGGLALLATVSGPARAAPEPPVVVALVLDTSGSLLPADLERTRALALGLLRDLPSGGEVAVFTFDDESRLVLGRTDRAEDVERAVAEARIAGRHTALYDALYDASRYLRDAPAPIRAVVLITDGKDEQSALDLEDGLEVAVSHQIPVFTVGVGHVEERTLRRIAKLTGGRYLPMAEADAAELATSIRGLPPAVTPAAPTPAARPSGTAPTASPPAPVRRGRLAPLAIGLWVLLVAGMLVAATALLLRARARGVPAGPVRRGEGETLLMAGPDAGLPVDRTVVLSEGPTLAIVRGPGTGLAFRLSAAGPTTLGRSPTSDILLEDDAVSGQHCRIRPEQGRFVIEDLRSTNGTYVNERLVSRHRLDEGDVVRLGETSLEFRTLRASSRAGL